jgi:16S rRNA (cytidine1402-2'-O)-methyltransferase
VHGAVDEAELFPRVKVRSMSKGKLYVVSTPIGNLEDLTIRALSVLKSVDLVAAEDTRHSRKLLSAHGIAKPMLSFWSEREKARTADVLDRIRSGLSVALVSDAGTPGISDPGALLIREAIAEGVEVVPIPGPSALIVALSVSGLPSEEFTFIGFLPPRPSQRKRRLQELLHEPRTLIFYEAPHRVIEMLEDIRDVLGDRSMSLSRELTKLHEETVRGTVSQVLERVSGRDAVGEYVAVVEGRHIGKGNIGEALSEVKLFMKRGKGRKEAVREVAEAYGVSKTELYNMSIEGEGSSPVEG